MTNYKPVGVDTASSLFPPRVMAALKSLFVPKNRDSVNAWDFGVVPTVGTNPSLWVDVSVELQAAVDYCITHKIGRLYLPAGNYLVNGTIVIGSPILIEGSFGLQMKSLSNALSGGGTVISTTAGTSGNFVFNFTPTSPAPNTWGIGLRNITFYGLATGTAVDRPCIRLDHVWSELYFENVNIFGFNRQGLVSQNSQDGSLLNVTILACGLDVSGSYASLDLLSNTNALHFSGLHIENTPYHLHVGNGARHNQFVDSKFEQYAKPAASTWSPIWIDTTYENAFLGCQFVQDSTNDSYFYSDSTIQPPFIKITGSNTHAVFTGCMFTTAEQTRQAVSGIGGRWFIVTTPATAQITGSSFSSVYTGAGGYPIVLSDYCVFTNNKLKTYTDGTTRQIVQMGQRNIIAGNVFLNQDTNAVTAGAIFNCTGQRNTFSSNEILGNYSAMLSGQAYQSVSEALRSTNVTVSGAIPNVGWVEPGASQIYLVTNPGTTIMTSMVGIPQREVTLLFTNTNTTLKGSGSSFALRDGVDVTPPAYSLMRFWYDGGTWWEISRSFSTPTSVTVNNPGAFLIVGNYSAPGGNLGTVTLSEGTVKGALLQAGRTGGIDTLALNVTTAGSAGALIRLGLYGFNLATNAYTLVSDGGTVDASTTGVKTVALTSASITKGNYYLLVAVCQGGATTKPIVQSITSADMLVTGSDAPTVLSNSLSGFQIAGGISGALPSSGTASVSVGIPRIAGRAV